MNVPRTGAGPLPAPPAGQAGADAFARRLRARSAQREEAVRRQRRRGARSAHERIGALLDPGSFTELGSQAVHRSDAPGLAGHRPPGDAVVTGHGTVGGRPVCCFAQDFTVFGGSLGEAAGEKIVRLMDLAMDAGAPLVGINDSAGGRIQEGPVAQSLYGQIFARNVRMSGAVPQISLIAGPCAGGAAYSPALTDFVVMVDGLSHMFVTGPEVTRSSVGEVVGLDELGGARMHSATSGTAHCLAADEDDAFAWIRALIGLLPGPGEHLPGLRPPPAASCGDPADAGQRGAGTFRDARETAAALLDGGGGLLEVHAGYARSVVVAFGRLGGCAVGVVAPQPLVADGALTAAACDKAARFVRTCDAYGLPVLSLVDAPAGPPPGAERGGARLLHAYAEATVPLLTVTTGTAAGLAHTALGSRRIGGDLHLAWPGALIEGRDAWSAAGAGVVDEVVLPRETRRHLHRALWLLRHKRQERPPKKHDNLPL
ncbi:carboxyl transferase domain-containing protein [Streptomyces sp. NPDC047002]|uniref:acyl-CoA carboxylase subunit beta n=1 Tax=Streptomyces sp. NPDC047002 TaxID=3155475 RepID=UPI0034541684